MSDQENRQHQIFIASDHAGFSLKQYLARVLPQALTHVGREVSVTDLGPGGEVRCDYPLYAKKVVEKVALHSENLGILVCGSGIGMAMAANRFPGMRAAVVENPVSARLAREHNHCNILCLGSRILAPEYATEIVISWFRAQPSLDGRHLARIQQFDPTSNLS